MIATSLADSRVEAGVRIRGTRRARSINIGRRRASQVGSIRSNWPSSVRELAARAGAETLACDRVPPGCVAVRSDAGPVRPVIVLLRRVGLLWRRCRHWASVARVERAVVERIPTRVADAMLEQPVLVRRHAVADTLITEVRRRAFELWQRVELAGWDWVLHPREQLLV